MPPGTPFGPGIRSLLMYLHHSHHIGFERLSRLSAELFGLMISEGAIANIFRRTGDAMAAAAQAITDKLLTAKVIASDETTTRTNGITQWQWVFISDQAVLHKIAPRRARSVAEDVLGDHQPDVWVSDRYAGQQQLGKEHQVCLAHVLRDVQYAIDSGDTIFAPKIRDHLRWAIGVGKRDVPATNNISEREIRPSVVFRKVTNGFRSDWGAQIHAGYRSVTGTARLQGQPAFAAMRDLIDRTFAVA